jgi:predicted P-loop ATPase
MPRSFENSSYTDIDKYKKYIKRNRDNFRSELKKYIESKKKPCLFCGETEQIEFHHYDPTKKENTVSSFRSYKKIDEELEKCWCLCSSCHKKLHQRMCDPLPSCYIK